jgi:hypothetical protein
MPGIGQPRTWLTPTAAIQEAVPGLCGFVAALCGCGCVAELLPCLCGLGGLCRILCGLLEAGGGKGPEGEERHTVHVQENRVHRVLIREQTSTSEEEESPLISPIDRMGGVVKTRTTTKVETTQCSMASTSSSSSGVPHPPIVPYSMTSSEDSSPTEGMDRVFPAALGNKIPALFV